MRSIDWLSESGRISIDLILCWVMMIDHWPVYFRRRLSICFCCIRIEPKRSSGRRQSTVKAGLRKHRWSSLEHSFRLDSHRLMDLSVFSTTFFWNLLSWLCCWFISHSFHTWTVWGNTSRRPWRLHLILKNDHKVWHNSWVV